MTTPAHDAFASMLGPAALGLLTTAERAELQEHLLGCASCREELPALTAVVERMAALDDLTLLDAPPADSGRVQEVVVRLGAERRRDRRRQVLLAGAASATVLAAGIVTASALSRAPDSAVPLEAVSVQTAQPGVEARAALVAHTWGVEIKLTASGLAPQPYRVRVTTDNGDVVDAGAFLGTGNRTLLCNLNTAVLRDDASSFVVLDPAGTPVLSAAL